MFKKLVSQLSLSPSAVSQLTFYGRRLSREAVSRQASAVAAILLIILQSAVILFPPAPTNAASPADVIHGGVVSRDDLLNRYDESPELQALYGALGLSRADLAQTRLADISSSDHTLKALSRTAHTGNEFEVTAAGHTYYMQPLHDWDIGLGRPGGSTYRVLQGVRASDHSFFAILCQSGNPVSRTYPQTPLAKNVTSLITPAPAATATPSPTAKPKTAKAKATPLPACTSLTTPATTGAVPFKASFTATGAASSSYAFNFGDGQSATSAAPTATHTYTTPGRYTATVQPVNGGITAAVTAACSVAITATGTPAAYTRSKTAVNLTQNVDATTRPANAGDEIRYHLSTKNTGSGAGNYVVVEHLQDVLEYADITDPGGGILNDGVLTWPTQSIAGGATLTTAFTVKIKSPIPGTPVGLSDKYSYDLHLDNVYGTAVRIDLTPSASKQFEAAAASLPHTGAPLATLIIMFVCGLALYFYSRNRQLQTEIKILRGEFEGGL